MTSIWSFSRRELFFNRIKADIALQRDGNASDQNMLHAPVSEEYQQFFERGFHRLSAASMSLPEGTERSSARLPASPADLD